MIPGSARLGGHGEFALCHDERRRDSSRRGGAVNRQASFVQARRIRFARDAIRSGCSAWETLNRAGLFHQSFFQDRRDRVRRIVQRLLRGLFTRQCPLKLLADRLSDCIIVRG